uniref:Sideroflexin-4 n=1 Tax=Callorhinchus milii TaxID=7868 RepID=V9KVX9_CALMI
MDAKCRREERSFFHRLLQWVDILDPTTLLASDKEIENTQAPLQDSQRNLKEPVKDEQIKETRRLMLSAVHPDTGHLIPLVFRPQAFMPIATPLVIGMLLPHRGMKPALFWQFLFHSYTAGFNSVNRNKTTSRDEKVPLKQVLLLVGSVTYTTCLGVFPQFVMYRYGLKNPGIQSLFRNIIPVPVLAIAGAFNAVAVRGVELEKGIEVTDRNGNVVGVSEAAGAKAVKDTAISRAVLIGTTVAVPNMLGSYLQRMNFIKRAPFALAPIRHIATALVFGLMVPVSFSLFPRIGKISRSSLEPLIQSATTQDELYYHRGL